MSCICVVLAGCSGEEPDGTVETSSTTTTTTTVPPGPTLDTTTDDVEAAMRSLVGATYWAEREPAIALTSLENWLVPDGPYMANVEGGLREQVERGLVATGDPEVLDVAVESQLEDEATVLVWMRSDAYEFVGPNESLPSPAFERTLFVYEIHRDGSTEPWRIFDRRIAVGI